MIVIVQASGWLRVVPMVMRVCRAVPPIIPSAISSIMVIPPIVPITSVIVIVIVIVSPSSSITSRPTYTPT